jgi:uncharacterized protein (DUF952 family)
VPPRDAQEHAGHRFALPHHNLPVSPGGAEGRPAEPIFHLTTTPDWEAARASGAYRLSTRNRTLEEVGFVHCSYRHQVIAVADCVYADQSELVLLVIDPGRLPSTIKAENVEDSEELFPHIYGPLDLDSVIHAVILRRDAKGRLRLPADL